VSPWEAFEQLAPVRALATSDWAYPLVSTLHLLGIALLIGSIVPVDLRLLGWSRGSFDSAGIARLRRIAAVGLALAVVTGAALFSVRASEYIENPWLLGKWACLAAGLVNVAWLSRWQQRSDRPLDAMPARVGGAISLGCWLAALACGRWIAFA
jgi:hypothetical protein